MKKLILIILIILITLLATACESERARNDLESDASIGPVCPDRASILRTDGGARCVCDEGYAGENCNSCASGYLSSDAGTCVAPPIDCVLDPDLCGRHGTCMIEGELLDVRQYCACDPGYSGAYCQLCAEGHQDNGARNECQPTCATAMLSCDANHLCDDSTGLASCVCPEGTTGENCELCALGYRRNTNGTCAAGCAIARLQCAEPTICVEGANGAECGCREGYAGASCDVCADGYSNIGAGVCAPGCENDATCGHGTCVATEDGAKYCACDAGWAGPGCARCGFAYEGDQCELCIYYHQRIGDGPCVPACANNATICGEHAYCIDDTEAVCICAASYAGDDCNTCAPNFVLDPATGICAPDLPDRFSYYALMSLDLKTTLAAIDPLAGEVLPMRTFDAALSFRSIAVDPATGTHYVFLDPPAVATLELASNTLTTIVTGLPASFYAGMTFDTSRNILYVTRQNGLLSINVADGTFTSRNLSPQNNLRHIAYDPARDVIVGLTPPYSPDLELFDVDPTTFQTTSRGIFDPGTVPWDGMSVTSSSDLLLIGHDPTNSGFASLSCDTAIERLGLGILPAPLRSDLFFTDSTTIESTLTSGDEIIGMYGTVDSTGTITVDTRNPDAYVCIISHDPGAIEVHVTATARFAKLLVIREQPGITISIAPNRAPPAEPEIYFFHSDQITPDPSPFVRSYNQEQTQDRRVACFQGCGIEDREPSDRLYRSTLYTVQRTGLGVIDSDVFTGFQLNGSLTRRTAF
jgi:hypothetical protein